MEDVCRPRAYLRVHAYYSGRGKQFFEIGFSGGWKTRDTCNARTCYVVFRLNRAVARELNRPRERRNFRDTF